MPFWSTNSKFWSDPEIQPKRPYRFIVPIPIIMPRLSHPASTQWFSRNFTSDGAISRLNKWQGADNIFEFPVISCTKPGFKTEAYRTTNGAGGYARLRQNQPAVYNFSPVILEIVDTVSHDLESTISALLYARGQIKNSHEIVRNPDAGRLISFGNELEPVAGAGCNYLVEANLLIYEVDADSPFVADNPRVPFSAGSMWPKDRVLKLRNSSLVGAEFGMLDYRAEQLSTVRLTIDYDSFDYKMVSLPPGVYQDQELNPEEARRRRQQDRREQRRSNRSLDDAVEPRSAAALRRPGQPTSGTRHFFESTSNIDLDFKGK